MYFSWGREGMPVLFKKYVLEHNWQFALTLLGVFVIAVIYELLTSLRISLDAEQYGTGESEPLVAKSVQESRPRPGFLVDVRRALLHTLQLGISYILMLLVMTYNVSFLLVLLAGAFIGYLAFAKTRRLFRHTQVGCHPSE